MRHAARKAGPLSGCAIRLATAGDAPGIHAIYAPIVRDTFISFEIEPPDVDESVGFVKVGTYRNVGFKRGEWHDSVWLQRALDEASIEEALAAA